jgi:hypothetical protein
MKENETWEVIEAVVNDEKPLGFQYLPSALSQLIRETFVLEDPAVTYGQFRR